MLKTKITMADSLFPVCGIIIFSMSFSLCLDTFLTLNYPLNRICNYHYIYLPRTNLMKENIVVFSLLFIAENSFSVSAETALSDAPPTTFAAAAVGTFTPTLQEKLYLFFFFVCFDASR